MSEQGACEAKAAIKASNQAFFRGIASIAAAALGGVVGSIMGGPIGAIKGASSFMAQARKLIKVEYKLDCKEAEKYRGDLRVEVNALEIAVDSVIAVRKELSALDSSYTRLEDILRSDTNSSDP